MARKTSIFDRAAKALENGSAAECKAALEALDELTSKEGPQLDAVRPPGQKVHASDGRVYGVLPTGKRFEKAAMSDDPEAVQECHEEHARLTARLDRAAALRAQLKARLPIVEREEAVAAAPAKAKEAVAALDVILDHFDAAVAEFNEVHARLKATTADLLEARKLDQSAPTVSLATFYRIGVALGYLPPQRRQVSEGGYSTPARVTTPLFGHSPTAFTNAKLLVPVPEDIWTRTKRALGMRSSAGRGLEADYEPDTSDAAVRRKLNDWYREVVRLLSRDDLDTARKLGPQTYRHGGKGKPDFDSAA